MTLRSTPYFVPMGRDDVSTDHFAVTKQFDRTLKHFCRSSAIDRVTLVSIDDAFQATALMTKIIPPLYQAIFRLRSIWLDYYVLVDRPLPLRDYLLPATTTRYLLLTVSFPSKLARVRMHVMITTNLEDILQQPLLLSPNIQTSKHPIHQRSKWYLCQPAQPSFHDHPNPRASCVDSQLLQSSDALLYAINPLPFSLWAEGMNIHLRRLLLSYYMSVYTYWHILRLIFLGDDGHSACLEFEMWTGFEMLCQCCWFIVWFHLC